MSEATVLIKKIEEKDGKRPYKLIDGNSVEYATFKDDIIRPARELIDKTATITFTEKETEKDGRTYTNRYLDKVEAAPEPVEEPKFGDGSYVKGKENPSTQRSISAAVALQQAVATLAHTFPPDATSRQVFERVGPLASEYFRWLLQRTGLQTDEDIPF
jgi:hypothetical protein